MGDSRQNSSINLLFEVLGLVTRQENEAEGSPPKCLLWFVDMVENKEGRSPVDFSTANNLLKQATNISSGLNLLLNKKEA